MSQPEILRWDQAYNRNGDGKLPRAVVNVIRTYVNNDTLVGWVKAENLALATGLQVRGVRKQIAANVAAGWLEIVESGNSSGLANTYRLTYPKGVLQDTVPSGTPSKGVPEDTITARTEPRRVSHRTPLESEGCPTGPVKGVLQDTPTSPRTSPQREVLRENYSNGNGVLQDTLAPTDPFGGSVGSAHPTEKASQSKGVPQDTIGHPFGPMPTRTAPPPTAGPDPFAAVDQVTYTPRKPEALNEALWAPPPFG